MSVAQVAMANEESGPESQRYRFRELDHSKQQVRLLHRDIESHTGASIWSLEHHDLDKAPPYKALSYAWGSEENMRVFVVEGGKKIAIRQNLHVFFQMADHDYIGSYLWVDQICIDQETVTERNHQVGLMEHVYRSADEVLIWLGDAKGREAAYVELFAYDWSSLALSDHCDQNSAEPPYLTIEPSLRNGEREMVAARCLQLLEPLAKADYWTRLWPMQEMLLARSACILIGTFKVDRRVLGDCTSVLGEMFEYRIRFPRIISTLMSPRKDYIGYHNLIDLCCSQKCSDPRDKLYAVLSLVSPQQRPSVDYSASVNSVFYTALQLMLQEWIEAKHAHARSRSLLDDILRTSTILHSEMMPESRPDWPTAFRVPELMSTIWPSHGTKGTILLKDDDEFLDSTQARFLADYVLAVFQRFIDGERILDVLDSSLEVDKSL